MFCPKCNSFLDEGALICPYCGEQLRRKRRRRSGMDRDAVIRLFIIITAVILLAGGVAGVGALAGWFDSDEPQPIKSPQKTVSALVPVHTPAQSPAATAPPVPAATAEPTPAPSPDSASAPAQAGLRITNSNEMTLLTRWMIDTGTLSVQLEALALSDEQITDAISDNPEITRWSYASGQTITLSLELDPGLNILRAWQNGAVNKLSAEDQQIAASAQQIIGSVITFGMSDLEKARALHDYIVANSQYQIAAETHSTDNVYGFFRHGLLQCSGYADTFRMLGGMCGLEIRAVSGLDDTGAGHEWNLIRIDGQWYAMDITWDECAAVDAGTPCYAYFMIPHGIFEGNRTWNEAVMPEGAYATAFDENNWYFRNGYYARTNDEAVSVLAAQLSAGNTAYICLAQQSADINALVESACDLLGVSASWTWIQQSDIPGMLVYMITIT